jgi:DNA-binding response OmpR family regulator
MKIDRRTDGTTMQRILVVDDERNLLLLYKMELEREGYDVIIAANGADGLRLFTSEVPDLVVLDIRMPGMDGLDVMARMLALNPRIPVILNSGYSSHMGSFMSWAADAYLVKSSDTGELRAKIREILAARARAMRPVSLEPAYEIDGRLNTV